MARTIIVFGSINMDLTIRLRQFPSPGQTIHAEDYAAAPGGKGANQAVAAARQGAAVAFIGCVGDDAYGPALRQTLAREKVDVASLATCADCHSGTAFIQIDGRGENQIVLAAGANRRVGQAALEQLKARVQADSIVMLQLEIPLQITREAARIANQAGATVLLDPAPAQALDEAMLETVDILTPNQHEASTLSGMDVTNEASAGEAGQRLCARGVTHALMKLGAEGVVWVHEAQARRFVACEVEAVDSVAAGDAFNGGLAAALANGQAWDEAIRRASATAALCVQRPGAQQAMPSRDEVDQLLRTSSASGRP